MNSLAVYPVAEIDDPTKLFQEMLELEDSSKKLAAILTEFKARTGKTPLFEDEKGIVSIHREARATLDEPGNEAALEFFRFMQRKGITKI